MALYWFQIELLMRRAASKYGFIPCCPRFGWVMQDILGTSFCINAMRTIRLPNLKVRTYSPLLVNIIGGTLNRTNVMSKLFLFCSGWPPFAPISRSNKCNISILYYGMGSPTMVDGR